MRDRCPDVVRTLSQTDKNHHVRLDERYHPYKNTLSRQQTVVLQGLLGRATDEERIVLEQLIREHSNYAFDL